MTGLVDLSERAQRLLKALTEQYILDGHPVGSRTLARKSGVQLSAATVRNVMSDLEDMGLVCSPHTSAGRIPTVSGYRVFVDGLLTVKPLDKKLIETMRSSLPADIESHQLLESASGLLSHVTNMAGIVMLPKCSRVALQRVEFLSMSRRTVLAVLIDSNEDVQNSIIHTERDYSTAELQEMSSYLNEQFAGKQLSEVRNKLLREMQEARDSLNHMMQSAVDMADRALTDVEQPKSYVLAGQTNLLDFEELCNVSSLRHLFEVFEEKCQLVKLLDQCIENQGVQIFIGEESGYKLLDECSLVTAPYSADGDIIGVLGIIGPTRMAYQKVIPIVDATAKILTAALNPRN
ncbi:MAG: heat-inducible transcriptional repressor HrcA [Gammaproteobacteria bacterium]